MRTKPLSELAQRYLKTPLSTVADTTDVSVFQELMKSHLKELPIAVVLVYSLIHVVFNQRYILQEMITKKAFLCKEPWVDWNRVHAVVAAARAENRVCRSSTYRATTLNHVVHQSGYQTVDVPTDPTARDVLTCRIVGPESLPHAICQLYDAKPSRDLWSGMLQEWLRQAQSKTSGAFSHYYMKCCLDRLMAVRKIDYGTISWWPTECPSYIKWYRILYPNRCSRAHFDTEEKFQILCAIYRKLNAVRNCSTFPEALAQTCWILKEKDNRLTLA